MFTFLLEIYLGVKLLIFKVYKYSVLLDNTKEFSEALIPISFPSANYEEF